MCTLPNSVDHCKLISLWALWWGPPDSLSSQMRCFPSKLNLGERTAHLLSDKLPEKQKKKSSKSCFLGTHRILESYRLSYVRYSPFFKTKIHDSRLVQCISPRYLGSCSQATPMTPSPSGVQITWPGERFSAIPGNTVIVSTLVSKTTTTGRCLPTNCSPQCGLNTYSLPCQ